MRVSSKKLAEIFVDAADGKTIKQVEALAKDFVGFLANRRELYRVQEVLRAVDGVWKSRYGAANITITTPYPLSRELRTQLEKASRGASIKETVDPALLGGARIRFDDRLIDGTIAGHLERLRQALSE